MNRLLRVAVAALVWQVAAPAAFAQQGDVFDFWLSESYVRQLAEQNTILFSLPLKMGTSTSKVKSLGEDCEIHIPAASAEKLAWPSAVVVEPPNVCKERLHDMPQTGALSTLWPRYLRDNVLGRECTVTGFPRLYSEHKEGGDEETNPDHVLQIHPALRMTCGEVTLDMRSQLKYYAGMRKIKPESAATCLQRRKLFVRRNQTKARYEFQEEGAGKLCGNFAIFHVTSINPEWVRKISGGHSALARVYSGDAGPFTLKLYTYESTSEDRLLEEISDGRDTGRGLYLHGMLSYDYFSILKTVRDRERNWLDAPEWTEVRFPLVLVVFGRVSPEEIE